MSVLARLLARATGADTSGLAPRLPARFETTRGDWDDARDIEAGVTQTAHSGQDAGRPPPPDPLPRKRQGISSWIDEPVGPTGQAADTPPPAPLLAPDNPDAGTGPLHEHGAPEQTLAPHTAAPQGQPRGQASPADPPPDPARARRDSGRNRPDAQPATSTRHASSPPPTAAPPAPLQPLAAENPFAGDWSRSPRTTQPDRPIPQRGAPDVSQPPDIVIHIGQIDVAAPAPDTAPAPPRTSRKSRHMTRLGDYLNPAGSAGEGKR